MNNTIKWIIGIIIVVAIVWFGFLNKSEPKQISNEPIKIGMIAPLTGDAASYGEPMRNVVQIAVDEINGAGGINGRNIELIAEDGKCVGADSVSAMNKLVNIDKVQVVIGGFCSGESLSAEPIATLNKVLLISGGSSSPDLTNKSFYFVRDYPSDATQGEVLAKNANGRNMKTIAFIQEQTDYSIGLFNSFSDNFNGKIIKEEFPSSTSDFRTQITKLKASNPDALFIDVQTPAAGEKIIRQLKELGWNVSLFVSDVVIAYSPIIEGQKDILEGAVGAEFSVNLENSKFQHLLETYKKKFNVDDMPIYSYAQTMYDTVYLLKEGIEKVGYNGDKLAKWIRTIENWEGASGLITIKPDGDREGGHVLKIVKDGKAVVLEQ
ncbi:ABC transporter substrate-binding protein [Candidatus Parcubacteria bacterium]|nr:ABC transporter substrate-binding protein [Candidatus Parcubacteria bacterium]